VASQAVGEPAAEQHREANTMNGGIWGFIVVFVGVPFGWALI
jgi:hypothetical protein